MNQEKIGKVKAECRRLLERIEALNAEKERERQKKKIFLSRNPGGHFYGSNFPREMGAIRRASLDLTRALADMRKP